MGEYWQKRTPLMTGEGAKLLRRLKEHPEAPRWNFEVGDRVERGDLERARAYREEVLGWEERGGGREEGWLREWVEKWRGRVDGVEERLRGKSVDQWEEITPLERGELATNLVEWVPRDADLERVIVYDTSGTTGHAIDVPTHPVALASAHVLCERALRAYGVEVEFGPGKVASLNICAQQSTYVFAAIFSVWDQAGFAKVNLREEEWPGGREGAKRYIREFSPEIVTTDPVGLSEMIAWELPVRPKAIFSTAVELSPRVKEEAEAMYGCPVIDWYSTTETGPIAFSAPDGEGMLWAAPDLYVEVVDEEGRALPEGEWGEILVTGGRNPYLPLLRYRTGDRGRLRGGRLLEWEGRAAVFFRGMDGSVVNPVDIARILRLHAPFVLHEFVQFRDGACRLRIRPVKGRDVDRGLMSRLLEEIFGAGAEIEVVIDEKLGESGKVIPYYREESNE